MMGAWVAGSTPKRRKGHNETLDFDRYDGFSGSFRANHRQYSTRAGLGNPGKAGGKEAQQEEQEDDQAGGFDSGGSGSGGEEVSLDKPQMHADSRR
jgi:hypothetical protein